MTAGNYAFAPPPAAATTRIWAGTNTHHTLWRSHLHGGVAALCSSLGQRRLRVSVNIWDRPPASDERTPACGELTHIRGAKPVFWRGVFTPQAVAAYDIVWLFDDDMLLWPPAFLPDAVVGVQRALNASIATPSMLAQISAELHPGRCPALCRDLGKSLRPGCPAECRATDRKEMFAQQPHPEQAACLSPLSEFQTAFFQADAWQSLHVKLLSQLPMRLLSRSDWGLSHAWCGLMRDVFPQRPSCILVKHVAAVHLNLNSIDLFAANGSAHKRRGYLQGIPLVRPLVAAAMATPHRCWSVQELSCSHSSCSRDGARPVLGSDARLGGRLDGGASIQGHGLLA